MNEEIVKIRWLEEVIPVTDNVTDDYYADPNEPVGDDDVPVNKTVSNEGSAIVDTLRVFGSIFLVFFCLFLCLRRKYPRYFNVRSWSPKIRCDLADDQHGFIKWLWELYFVKDETILEQCGMDALCFLRSLWFGVKLSLMGIFNACYLMPIYATSDAANTAPSKLAAVSTAYVPPESNRFYATVVATYVLYLYAMYLILQEFKWYTKYRHKFLMQKKPRNYAVYVSGIPDEYRSSYALKEYFRQCFSKEGVIEAHVAMEIPDLERKVQQRKRVQANLEHTMALERFKGITPMHQSVQISTGTVVERELAEVYEEQLERLNEEIRDAIRKIKFKNDQIQDTFQRSYAKRSGLSLEEEEEEDEFSNMDWKAYRSANLKLFPLTAPSDDSPRGGIRRRRLSTINSIDSGGQFGSPFSVGSPCSAGDSETSSLEHDSSVDEDIETGLKVDTSMDIEQDVTEDEEDLILKRPTLSKEDGFESSNFGIFQSDTSTRAVTPSNVDADDPSAVFANAFFGWPLTPPQNIRVEADAAAESVDRGTATIADIVPETVESSSETDDVTENNEVARVGTSPVTISATRITEDEPFNCYVADPVTLNYNCHGADKSETSSQSELRLEQAAEIESQDLALAQTNDSSNENGSARQSFTNPPKLLHEASQRASQVVKDGSGKVLKVVTDGSEKVKKVVTDGSQHALRASTSVVKGGSGILKKVVVDGSGQVKNVVKSGSNQAKKVVVSGSGQVTKVVKEGSHQVTKRVKEVNPENIKRATDFGVQGVKKATGAGVSQIAKVTDMGVDNVKSFASYVLGSGDGTPLNAGFVVFSKLSTTHAALQMIHHPRPFVMDVHEAPMPDDIYWKNVGMPHKAKQTGKLISLGLSGLLCLTWTVPVSFISSLTEVETLRESVPAIDNMLTKAPWMEFILQQLAPLLLLCLNAFLPFLLRFISTFEGHIAASALEASLFRKMAAFQIIQTFFVSAISGGIWAELSNILRSPEEVINLLARSLPAQSTYFIQIILVDTFVGLSTELLRVLPLGMAAARRCIGPNLTPKERNSVFMFLHPLSDPWEFQGAEIFGQAVLFFVTLFVYATTAPIMCFFLLFCWLLSGSCYRHQFFYNYGPDPDSGGKMWSSFISICLICMLIGELTLVGMLALKKCPIQSTLMIPLIIITVLFNFYIGMKHFYVTDHLPTRLCLQLDRKNHHNGGLDFSFVKQKYLQPALLEHEIHLSRREQDRGRSVDDSVSECSHATGSSKRVARAIRIRM